MRAADYDRYLSVLFAAKEKRPALFALYAFNYEVAKTAEAVSEPTLGFIRLQWWREAVEEIYTGTQRRHEIVRALSEAIAGFALPREFFDALITAREQDLSPAPFVVLTQLEVYADATSANLMRLAARILGAGDTLDGHARALGIGYALTGLLRSFPHHAAAGRIMLPLAEIASAGVSESEIVTGRAANLSPLFGKMIASAEGYLAGAGNGYVPRAHLPALLPAALVPLYLKRMKAAGFAPYRQSVDVSVPRKQLAMLSALLRGKIGS